MEIFLFLGFGLVLGTMFGTWYTRRREQITEAVAASRAVWRTYSR